MKPFRFGSKKISEYLSSEGLNKKSFTLVSEGRYEPDDADWNYKDIPHLKMMHKLISNHLIIGEDNLLASIAFQKIFGFFRIPLCLINYDFDDTTQIYYTSFFSYILLIETKIIKLGTNSTRVETTYHVFGGLLLPVFFFLIKFLLSRNYKILMADDIPMRDRRGQLRDAGYKFSKDNVDGKYSYLETTRVAEQHVFFDHEYPKKYEFSVPLSSIDGSFNNCIGTSDSAGFRIEKKNEEIHIYPRMCNHEGADLSCAVMKGRHLVCPWHGKLIEPLLSIGSQGEHYVVKNGTSFSLKNGVLLIKSIE